MLDDTRRQRNGGKRIKGTSTGKSGSAINTFGNQSLADERPGEGKRSSVRVSRAEYKGMGNLRMEAKERAMVERGRIAAEADAATICEGGDREVDVNTIDGKSLIPNWD